MSLPLHTRAAHRLRHFAAVLDLLDEPVRKGFFARHTIPPDPTGRRQLTIMSKQPRSRYDRRLPEVGHLDYQVCHLCRLGKVWKITVHEEWQRNGFATWLLSRTRRGATGYRWVTSGQMRTARPFWEFVKNATGDDYQQGGECRHMDGAYP